MIRRPTFNVKLSCLKPGFVNTSRRRPGCEMGLLWEDLYTLTTELQGLSG